MVVEVFLAGIIGGAIGAAVGQALDEENISGVYGQDEIWKIGPSTIDGVGVIANRKIRSGELVGVAIQQGFLTHNITPFGSKLNHSYNPTGALRYDYGTKSDNIYATRDLNPGEEITVDYRKTPDFIAGPEPHYQ
jgi:hypothetical protein